MVVRITGDRIYLRPLTVDDCSLEYVAWLNEPQINRYLETRWSRQDMASVKAFVAAMDESPDNLLCGIFLNEEDRHIGNIKVGPINRLHNFADVSYFVGDRSAWGSGYGSEAVALMTRYALEELKLHKVMAGVYRSNIGSIRVLEKNGYRLEACFTNKLRLDDGWEDHLVYSLLRAEIEIADP